MVKPLFDVIEYSDNYSKKSGILWQYCRDQPVLETNNSFTDFNTANTATCSFKI